MRKTKLVFLLSSVITAMSAFHPAMANDDGSDTPRTYTLAPSVDILRSSLSFDDRSLRSGSELASGVVLGLRLVSDTNASKTFAIGFDLRQTFARSDNTSSLGILATRLGVRGDWLVNDRFQLGAAWYFGDTIVIRHRDLQYNGSTAAVFFVFGNSQTPRWFLSGSFGGYQEGPGFILLSRRPGNERMEQKSISVGFEYPFSIAAFGR